MSVTVTKEETERMLAARAELYRAADECEPRFQPGSSRRSMLEGAAFDFARAHGWHDSPWVLLTRIGELEAEARRLAGHVSDHAVRAAKLEAVLRAVLESVPATTNESVRALERARKVLEALS